MAALTSVLLEPLYQFKVRKQDLYTNHSFCVICTQMPEGYQSSNLIGTKGRKRADLSCCLQMDEILLFEDLKYPQACLQTFNKTINLGSCWIFHRGAKSDSKNRLKLHILFIFSQKSSSEVFNQTFMFPSKRQAWNENLVVCCWNTNSA